MRKFEIIAGDKKHFESLISNGFMRVILGKRLAELESEDESVTIKY